MEGAVLVPGGMAVGLAVSLLLAGLTSAREFELLPLVLWLAGGAVVGGLVGWGAATVFSPANTLIGFGFGFAIGGGLGAVSRLISDEAEPEPPESVTVSMEGQQDDPGPQPVDLFEAHPDPLLYYVDGGEGPVVRAANRAFAEAFGVSAGVVEGAALADALMVDGRASDVVDAAAEGGGFDEVLAGEEGGEFRVRVAAVSDEAGARGYVLYSPAG
jgi:hypothetical protein